MRFPSLQVIIWHMQTSYWVYEAIDTGDPMKKILFIATVESHVINFHILFIRYFQEKGFEVHVATKLGRRQEELKDVGAICHDVDFERFPHSVKNVKAFFQLVGLMRRNKYTLVHVHTPVGVFLGRLAAEITNMRPVLYTAHAFTFIEVPPGKTGLFTTVWKS